MKKFFFIFFCFSFFIYFINCQLIRISPPNSLFINDFQPQRYLYFPSSSNDQFCYYDLKFSFSASATYFSPTLNGVILFSNSNSNSNSSYHVIQSSGIINVGSTISNITVTSSDLESIYSLNITCSLIPLSQLSLEIDERISYDDSLGYYSTVRIYGMDYHKFDFLETTTNSSGLATLGRSNNYIYIWNKLIFEKNMSSTFNLSILIFGNTINLTTNSFYYNVPPPLSSQYYQIYPPNLLDGNSFIEFGYHYSPLLNYISDSQSPVPYRLVLNNKGEIYSYKLILGNKTNIKSIVGFQNFYGNTYFQTINVKDNIPFRTTINMSITKFSNGFFGPISATMALSNKVFFRLVSSSFTGVKTYDFFNFKYSVDNKVFINRWPFGFYYGNNDLFNFSSVLQTPLYSENKVFITFGPNTIDAQISYNISLSSQPTPDTSKPILTSYNFTRLKGKNSNILFSFTIISNNGVERIKFNGVDYGLKSLVAGSNLNGNYEIIFEISDVISFECYDIYSNYFSYLNNYVIKYDPIFIFKVPEYLQNYYNVDSFDNIKFLKNSLNLLNSVGYNTMYLNSSTIDPDTPLTLILKDPISISYQSIEGNSLYGSFPIVYDSNLKLFKCDFIIPSNNLFGEVKYHIKYTNGLLTSNQLGFSQPKLIVNETYLDNQGPIFSYFEKLNDGVTIGNDNTIIGWKFNVTDEFNGFSSGSIVVRGSLDSSKYVFNFTLLDSLSGDKMNSQYEILISISKQCMTQTFIITNVFLTDLNGISSVYNIYSDNIVDPTLNPFMKFYSQGINITQLSILCNPSIVDNAIPELLSFNHSISTSTIDVGKFNNSITFEFSIATPPSGIKDHQSPIVYIISNSLESIECISQLVKVDTTYGSTNFTCSIVIPFGFGYPGPLVFSVYGFINNAGYYFGYSTFSLVTSFPSSYYVNTKLSIDNSLPIITSTDSIYSTGGSLLIYGRALSTTKQVLVYYSETGSESILIQNTTYGSSAVLINSIAETKKPFKIQIIINSGLKSNEYWVNPIYFESPIPPTIPTNPPQKCLGNPECGGKSQGYCSPNGCICYPPWIGTFCQSKVILVPPPIVNPSEPSTNLTTNSTNNEVSSLVGVISIVSLRELNINNQVIKTNRFEKWNQTNLEKNRNIYTTSIKFSNNINDCIVNVETKWYEKLTNISFANQVLIMNPSTLKYNINITSYPFENKLNTLQLVIKAKLTQNNYDDDVCSGQDFGNTVADNSEYVQLSVKDHSLYGRFVKRAIVDGRLLSINNIKLDDLDDESNYYTSESYIGIQIPQYTSLVQLDPDFGLLVDSSSTDSICKDSSSLSRAAKIGIIVGCVGFVIVVVIVVALSVKYKYHLRNLKSEIKMKRKQ